MAAKDLILSIDQGTTSTRAIAFTIAGDAVATAQRHAALGALARFAVFL